MEIEKISKNALFLHEELASGTTGEGEKFRVCRTIPGNNIYITFPEASYLVSIKTLLEKVLEYREKQKGENT